MQMRIFAFFAPWWRQPPTLVLICGFKVPQPLSDLRTDNRSKKQEATNNTTPTQGGPLAP